MPFKILLVVLIVMLPMIPTFWAIIDIPKRRFASRAKKIIWFAVVATLPFFGAMLYIFIARRSTEPVNV
jgi:hypothetical protein